MKKTVLHVTAILTLAISIIITTDLILLLILQTLKMLNWGRYRITFLELDKGKYHTPSLRNIAVSAPYMHDGRFKTLAEVIEHYSNGIKNSIYTAQELPKNGFQFSIEEKQALEAFLISLTDETFLSNLSFSNPTK